MDDDRSHDIVPIQRAQEQAVQPHARAILLAWLADPAGGAFDRVGRDAIRAAADATGRLSRLEPDPAADGVLAEVEALAASLAAPPAPPARAWWPARRAAPPSPPLAPDALAPLVDRLDRQRDVIARRAITLHTDRARLAEADGALEQAIHLVRALAGAVEAAARELRVQDPRRAARLAEVAGAALPERERAVLMQLAIHRQAMLTLDLLHANQTTLATALDGARTATLAALQVAIAARRATDHGDALAANAGAMRARQVLDDAVTRARAALAAMTAPVER